MDTTLSRLATPGLYRMCRYSKSLRSLLKTISAEVVAKELAQGLDPCGCKQILVASGPPSSTRHLSYHISRLKLAHKKTQFGFFVLVPTNNYEQCLLAQDGCMNWIAFSTTDFSVIARDWRHRSMADAFNL